MKETVNFAELVTQATNGNNEAFEKLYRFTVKNAYRTANLILSNPSDAEDVVQNAYIKAAEKLPELKKPESFDNWLKSIVENECKNYIRKEKRINAPIISLKRKAEEEFKEPAEPIPHEITEREELRSSVTDILNSLSHETRACIVLFHYEDKSINEISDILNIPVGTVKSRLHNGRKKIEKQFDKLRKKDPTLYGIGAIPVLLSFIAYQSQNITVPAAISTAAAITAGTTAGATTASSAVGTTAAAATAGTTVSAAAATATTATAIAAKATAIVVAGSLAVGGTAVIKKQIEKNAQQTTAYSSETEESGTAEQQEIYYSETFITEITTEPTVAQKETVKPTPSTTNTNILSTTQSKTQQTTSSTTQVRQTTLPTTETTQSSTQTTEESTETQTTSATTTQVTTQTPTQTTQQPTTNPDNNYKSSSGVITEYNGTDKNVSIPSEIGGNTVTAIGASAFQNNTNISSISIPDTVTQIGQEAFADCTSLSSVYLPSSLKQIGIGAFYGCSSLNSIEIPDSVTTIGDEAFADCTSLRTITIPSSVTSISDDAFIGCDSLTIVCTEGSPAHNFAVNNAIDYSIITI